ncbi:MAG: nitrilase-related carbon-nitrogen hydrolase [Acidobacteriota bacterium]
MRDIRVALGQIAPRLGDFGANLEAHRRAAREAVGSGSDLIVFPELSLTGYLLADQVPELAISLDDPRLEPLLEASQEIDIVAGLVEDAPGHRFHNTALYVSRGRVLHAHRKLHLPTYGLFQEGREFAAGNRVRHFDSPWGPAGMLICEDLWHMPCAWLLAQQGAEVIFVLSNGPTRGAKPGREVTSVAVWRELLQITAQFQTTWMVYVNRVGCEDGLTFGGGSLVVDPFGRVAGNAPALDEALEVVDLKSDVLRRARTAYPLLRDENLELVERELGRLRQLRYDLPDPTASTEKDKAV